MGIRSPEARVRSSVETRRGDEEGHAVLLGQDRDGVGADLVGDVAIGGDAVGAHDDAADAAGLHEVARPCCR